MDKNKENLFKLQVFQQTLSTLYMYPLRVYKNNSYTEFKTLLERNGSMERLRQILFPDESLNSDKIIKTLQDRVKTTPQSIDSDSEIYQILKQNADDLRQLMWETQASNSLTFTREIKGDRRLWTFLMFYDLSPETFIDEYFNEPCNRACLIDMHSVYVKLDKRYTLSVGRLFTEKQKSKEVVANVIKNYDFDNMNMLELSTLSQKRRTFNIEKLKEKTRFIQKAFQLFLDIEAQLPDQIHKSELEKVAIFIYMVTKSRMVGDYEIQTNDLHLSFKNERLTIVSFQSEPVESDEYEDELLNFANKSDFFRSEYASRLKSALTRKYSVFQSDKYSAVNMLLKHICNRLGADGGCYVQYALSTERLELISTHGDDDYIEGIGRLIKKINNDVSPEVRKKSRVLQVIQRYFLNQNQKEYDIDRLILHDLSKDMVLQPVKEKPILSNLALPIMFKHKLLGVLLIDSFRPGNFTEDDINLVLSIINAMSVQIYEQIVEENLFGIIENLPQKAELDAGSIQKYFENLTGYINNIFFSYGVAIWQYDQDNKSFQLKSTTLTIKNTAECTITESSNDLIFDLLHNIYNTEEFMVKENDIEHTGRLSVCNPKNYDPRINCVHIYPISNGENLIGALSVYNHSSMDFKAIDQQSLHSVIKHLAIFFNIMDVLKAQRALIQSQALHEINARLNMIEDKSTQLKELVNLNFKELDMYARYRFNIKIEDIKNLVRNNRLTFKYLANQVDEDKIKYKNHVDREVDRQYKPIQQENIEVNNVRDIINGLTNSIPYPYNRKNIHINNMVNDKIALKVHNLILSDIFQNLIINAVKYSFQGTTIRLFSKEKENSIRISIKNDGLEIKKGEEIDIFKYGYRGFNAKTFKEEIEGEEVHYLSHDEENLGIGLYKCNKLVKEVLGGEIRLTREESKFRNGAVNTFEIILPIKLLRGDKHENHLVRG